MADPYRQLDPKFVDRLRTFEAVLLSKGIRVRLTCGYRSREVQDALYAQGRTAPGRIVTNARGGESWHNYGLAADYVFIVDGRVSWDGPWDRLGRVARSCGLEWGGDWKRFKDRPHVQWRKGKSLAQMKRGGT
jgi:peptidoglycan L-alanyl-D-glutamate endopeptidase CwlK